MPAGTHCLEHVAETPLELVAIRHSARCDPVLTGGGVHKPVKRGMRLGDVAERELGVLSLASGVYGDEMLACGRHCAAVDRGRLWPAAARRGVDPAVQADRVLSLAPGIRACELIGTDHAAIE